MNGYTTTDEIRNLKEEKRDVNIQINRLLKVARQKLIDEDIAQAVMLGQMRTPKEYSYLMDTVMYLSFRDIELGTEIQRKRQQIADAKHKIKNDSIDEFDYQVNLFKERFCPTFNKIYVNDNTCLLTNGFKRIEYKRIIQFERVDDVRIIDLENVGDEYKELKGFIQSECKTIWDKTQPEFILPYADTDMQYYHVITLNL